MLSIRLQEIANLVESNKVVFDVGSDHALLPCFLVSEGICKKAYAGDIALGPLDNAKETIERYKLTDKVIPVFSDGLKMAKDDVDIVTISGMGFNTVKHILDECDVSRYQYFIVQINKDVELLRKYISDHHYTIEDEVVVHDDFYYQIIKFSADYSDGYNDMQIKYGPILLQKKTKTFLEYLNYQKNKLIQINLSANKSEYAYKIKELEDLINSLI